MAARRFTREARVYTIGAPAPPPSSSSLPLRCSTPRRQPQHRTQRMNGRQQGSSLHGRVSTYVRTQANIANVDTYVTCNARRRGRFVDRCVTLAYTSLPTYRSPSFSILPECLHLNAIRVSCSVSYALPPHPVTPFLSFRRSPRSSPRPWRFNARTR